MNPVYEAWNLQKRYGAALALNIPSFRLEKGESLIITGPNGSGKSTFLRILAFLEEPSSGTLKYFGAEPPRRYCSLLLQEPWLMRESVFNNVTLGLKLRGDRHNLTERYLAAMRDAGFAKPENFAKRKPYALSGGEKQRVALAARLILQPAVLLLDEPTAYVDCDSAACIAGALKNAHEKGMTIICATHDTDLAKFLDAPRMKMGAIKNTGFCC